MTNRDLEAKLRQTFSAVDTGDCPSSLLSAAMQEMNIRSRKKHVFWKQFRREIKSEFPDALIIGEIWYYAEDFLQGDEWDTVMNYPFYRSVIRLAANSEISPAEFAADAGFMRGRTHPGVYPLLWNLIGSHDTARILHRCGGNKARVRLAAALQLLLPGMPMIYYGDEYGLDGGDDPDCRRGMLWDPERQDLDLYAWYQALIRFRKQYPWILEPDAQMRAEDTTCMLIRKCQFSGQNITIFFHCGDSSITLREYADRTEMLTAKRFCGVLGPFETAVFLD